MKNNKTTLKKKKLTLGKEVVRRLDDAALGHVNGGYIIRTFTCVDWGCEIIDSQRGHSCVDWC